MSEMIERLAPLVYAAMWPDNTPAVPWAVIKNEAAKAPIYAATRAILQAMKEPTEQMKERASYNAAMGHSEVSPALADDVWSWMIDAALEPKPPQVSPPIRDEGQ